MSRIKAKKFFLGDGFDGRAPDGARAALAGRVGVPTDLAPVPVSQTQIRAVLVDEFNVMIVCQAGADRLGSLHDLVEVIHTAEPGANIIGGFVGRTRNYTGQFLFLEHKDPDKLTELAEKFDQMRVVFPDRGGVRVFEQRTYRMSVKAPDGPGVLLKVCKELVDRQLNIQRLDGDTFEEFDATDLLDDPDAEPTGTFAKLTFTLGFSAAAEETIPDLARAIRKMGNEWRVKFKSLTGVTPFEDEANRID